MTRVRTAVTAAAALVLSACVTINIYFPEAKAEEAIQAIVEDVLDKEPVQQSAPGDKSGARLPEGGDAARLALGVLDWLVPPAEAAPQPDFTVESPEIRRLQAQMKSRQRELEPFFASGAIGFNQEGLVEVRDPSAVGLRERNRLETLVEAENRDRNALYEAIAKANGQPDWEPRIRGIFAKEWIAEAPGGWWYRDESGAWKQK